MAFYYIEGGTSDVKARAFAYIRDRLPTRPVTLTRYERDDDGGPVPPAFIRLTYEHRLMTNGPLAAFHDDNPVAIDCKGCTPLGIVERIVDATGVKLLGYDDHAVQVEPKLLVGLSVYDIWRMLRCEWLEDAIVHAFALEPKYAGLPIDLTVDANQRGFRSNRSAAYCGMHATVSVYSDPALLDAYDMKTHHGLKADPGAVSLCFDIGLSKVDVGRILGGIVATATRVIGGDVDGADSMEGGAE